MKLFKFNHNLYEIKQCIYLVCICNSEGSTKNDDSACDNKCCNDDGTCKCNIGYSGNDCNTCDTGYYVSDTVQSENTCNRKEQNINPDKGKLWYTGIFIF